MWFPGSALCIFVKHDPPCWDEKYFHWLAIIFASVCHFESPNWERRCYSRPVQIDVGSWQQPALEGAWYLLILCSFKWWQPRGFRGFCFASVFINDPTSHKACVAYHHEALYHCGYSHPFLHVSGPRQSHARCRNQDPLGVVTEGLTWLAMAVPRTLAKSPSFGIFFDGGTRGNMVPSHQFL